MSNYIIDIQNTTDELIQMNDNRVEISIAFDEDDTCLLPSGKDNTIVCLSSGRLPNQFLSAKPSNVLSIYLSTFLNWKKAIFALIK